MRYFAYGLTIEADVELSIPEAESPADILVKRRSDPMDERAVVWFAVDEATGWRTGRRGDVFILGFTDVASFTVTNAGDRVDWWCDGLETATLAHLILDHVLPIALARRGHAVLHAAVLARPSGGAYAVAGRSGWGKSTLASALVNRGHELLADDCAVITLDGAARKGHASETSTIDGSRVARPRVAPAYPGVRLHGHSVEIAGVGGVPETGEVSQYSAKRRFAVGGDSRWNGARSRSLDTIFVLDPPTAHGRGRSTRLGGPEALFTMLAHSFHVGDGADRSKTLGRLGSLAEAVDVIQLAYARTPVGLERVMDEIEWWAPGQLRRPGPR